MTRCQWSGCVLARRTSLKHVQSTSALSIRPVPDVAYLAPQDIRPTSSWCWTFHRSILSATGSTEESLRSVSLMTSSSRRSLVITAIMAAYIVSDVIIIITVVCVTSSLSSQRFVWRHHHHHSGLRERDVIIIITAVCVTSDVAVC